MIERKKALVTGGATGIGRSAVLALAKAGYDIAINYASSAKGAQATAAEAQALGAKTMLTLMRVKLSPNLLCRQSKACTKAGSSHALALL